MQGACQDTYGNHESHDNPPFYIEERESDNSWLSFEICDEYVSCKVYEISDQRITEILW